MKSATKKRKKKKGSPTTVSPFLAEKANETRSADSSDSDEFSETQTPAASMSLKAPVPESHDATRALDASHQQMAMNGFHKPHSDMGRNGAAEMVGPAAVDQRTCVSERLGDEQYHRQTITYDHQRRKTQTQPRCR